MSWRKRIAEVINPTPADTILYGRNIFFNDGDHSTWCGACGEGVGDLDSTEAARSEAEAHSRWHNPPQILKHRDG